MSAVNEMVPLNEVLEAITTGRVPELADNQQLADSFINRLLQAESADELFSVAEATPVEQIFGEVVQAMDVTFMPSTIEDGGTAVYAIIHVINMEGDRLAVTSGGRNIVTQMYMAVSNGWLPQWGMFREVGQQKANRNRPQYFIKQPDPTLPAAKPTKNGRRGQ